VVAKATAAGLMSGGKAATHNGAMAAARTDSPTGRWRQLPGQHLPAVNAGPSKTLNASATEKLSVGAAKAFTRRRGEGD
jgi:hypothetical protein